MPQEIHPSLFAAELLWPSWYWNKSSGCQSQESNMTLICLAFSKIWRQSIQFMFKKHLPVWLWTWISLYKVPSPSSIGQKFPASKEAALGAKRLARSARRRSSSWNRYGAKIGTFRIHSEGRNCSKGKNVGNDLKQIVWYIQLKSNCITTLWQVSSYHNYQWYEPHLGSKGLALSTVKTTSGTFGGGDFAPAKNSHPNQWVSSMSHWIRHR